MKAITNSHGFGTLLLLLSIAQPGPLFASNPVAQTFVSAGSGDFPVPSALQTTVLESTANPQAGKPAPRLADNTVKPSGTAPQESPTARAERAFLEAQASFTKNGSDPEIAWQFGLACFDWADLATSNARRAEIAEKGIAACRQAVERAPKLAAAHYYLGLNLGQLAQTKKMGALKLIPEIEAEFLSTVDLDPKLDYAGGHRSVGLLYLDAPGWPASLGNRGKARLHLRKAVDLSPDFPDNVLSLLEAYLKWGEKSAVQSQLASTESVLQRARTNFTGPKWELSWRDWDHRWEKIKAKAAEAPSHLESPRNKR